MSQAYPDVLDIIREVANEKPNIEDFIIDSELVAYDIENQQILPF
jgi:ATP-dependent DNA ligase